MAKNLLMKPVTRLQKEIGADADDDDDDDDDAVVRCVCIFRRKSCVGLREGERGNSKR
jgi:hypothetical protein